MSEPVGADARERSQRARRRLAVLVVVLSLWTAGLATRLFHLQVTEHAHYAGRAERQQQRIVRLDGPRGTIYDARGRELAVSVEVQSAYAVPADIAVEQIESTAAALAPILDVPAAQLRRQLESERDFVWLARKLEPSQSEAVGALDLDGVYFLPESKRYYPLGEIAAPILGYVGTDNLGLGGLESEYDELISGKTATRTVLRDLRGRFLDVELSFAEAEPGADLYLTLDASLQYLAETELRRAVESNGAQAGTVVLLDARDSAVLAMASFPTFDPNRFTAYDESSWRNRAVMDAFEPGSTFKMVTAGAALEHEVVGPSDLFDCEQGGLALASTYISDHRPFGVLTFREVLARSSNVGIIKVAQRVGSKRFYATVEAFGFGRPSGIDLPGESAGILKPFSRWSDLATAYGAFGMGLSVTAVQLASAYAAVARGGELLSPYVVAAHGRRGELQSRRPPQARRAVSVATSVSLVDMLETVVEAGTGTSAAVAGYRVAGKTGTAEKSSRSGYSETGRVASFVGMAPAGQPRLVGLVVLDEPTSSPHGGDVAAPVFSRVVGSALLYLGIPPAPSRDEAGPSVAWLRLRRDRLARVQGEKKGSESEQAVRRGQDGRSRDATL